MNIMTGRRWFGRVVSMKWRRVLRWAWIIVFVVFLQPTLIGFFILRDRAIRAADRMVRSVPESSNPLKPSLPATGPL
jgi:hypothetical protein